MENEEVSDDLGGILKTAVSPPCRIEVVVDMVSGDLGEGRWRGWWAVALVDKDSVENDGRIMSGVAEVSSEMRPSHRVVYSQFENKRVGLWSKRGPGRSSRALKLALNCRYVT